MQMRPITANPSQVMVEQLAASGVKYVFNNSGSREARFLMRCMCIQIYTASWHSMKAALQRKQAVIRRQTSIQGSCWSISVQGLPNAWGS